MKKRALYIAFYMLGIIIMYFSFFNSTSAVPIEDIYLKIFSFNPITEQINLRNLLFTFLNLISASYIAFTSSNEYIGNYGQYIFLRRERGWTWVAKKWGINIFRIIVFYLTVYLLFFIWIKVFNDNILINEISLYIILLQLVSVAITLFVLVGIIDTISYYYSQAIGIIVSSIGLILSFISIVVLDMFSLITMIKFIPFTQHLIMLQKIDIRFLPEIIFNDSIQGYTYSWGIAYNLLILSICFIISSYRIKTMDII